VTLEEYQRQSRDTAAYPTVGKAFVYPALGLAGEAGEVAEKVKKVMRDRGGSVDDAARVGIAKELGDVLWYVAQLATELGLSLEEVAAGNLSKLRSRKNRGRLHGDGDHR
jgi:NTP pyrophosphatase (non-canonical NTP hydrolase)